MGISESVGEQTPSNLSRSQLSMFDFSELDMDTIGQSELISKPTANTYCQQQMTRRGWDSGSGVRRRWEVTGLVLLAVGKQQIDALPLPIGKFVYPLNCCAQQSSMCSAGFICFDKLCSLGCFIRHSCHVCTPALFKNLYRLLKVVQCVTSFRYQLKSV